MTPTRRALAGTVLGALLTTTAACAPPSSGPSAAVSLELFGSCSSMLSYLQDEALERVTAWGLGGGPVLYSSASNAAAVELSGRGGDSAGFSGTNNQVEGVDEADVVKTNGEVVVTSVSGAVRVVDVVTAEVVGTVRVPGLDEGTVELLLDGDSLVVLGSTWQGWGAASERTTVARVDIADPTDPRVVGTTRLEGTYTSARMIDGTVRLVMSSQPPGLAFSYPEDGSMAAEADALAQNRRVIAESTIGDWLPHRQPVAADGTPGTAEPLLDCTEIGRPDELSGFTTTSVVTLSADGDASPTSAAGVLAGGGTVYASTERVVVATSPWESWALDTISPRASSRTDLHTFDVSDPAATRYVASGRVEGWLLNQFAIDMTDGVLRVATTLDPPSSAEPSSSSLVVLTEDGDRLVETGRVDGLGETERIYAVWYLGPELAAVVTFRETDPLYLIDTSDPAAPRMTGELKIPGYSAYLHPLGDDLLLGVGQDAEQDGRTTGLQVSLFDVSDLADPRRVDQVTWEDTSSSSEWDHRAFLLWEDRVYLPAQTYAWDEVGDGDPQVGLVTVDVVGSELREAPRVDTSGAGDPWAGGVTRVLVADDALWAVGWTDLFRFDLDTLDGGAVATL